MTGIDWLSDNFNGLLMSCDWIRDLESSDSRNFKESVIEKALIASRLGSANAQCFLYNCYQAYNPFYVYGVRVVETTEGLTNRPNPWTKFWGLLESLRTRVLTGNAARTAITEISQQFDSDQWNGLARRVILKDLRVGISEKTLNRVLKNSSWRIPVFECQLAQDSADHAGKMTGIKQIEYKLDGVRVLAVVDSLNYGVTLYSRNGKIFENFTHIELQLQSICRELSIATFGAHVKFVLDGEVIGQTFQDLMKQARRKRDAHASDSVYNVFDIVEFEQFMQGHVHKAQQLRTNDLAQARDLLTNTNAVRVVDHEIIDLSTATGQNLLNVAATRAIDLGYEGLMIKDINASYECRRSSNWLKWKPTISVDLAIVDVEEGTGRNQGRLGAIVCEGVDNNRAIRVNVGSGFSDTDRNEFWANRATLVGQLVEIKADIITQNQDGTYSLRFPRFERFRGFDKDEKI